MQLAPWILCCGLFALARADDLIVATTGGLVQGALENYAGVPIRAFKGIPYGAPPVGDLRFASPVPAASWRPNVLSATAFKPGCAQHCVLPPLMCPTKYAEDCLNVNVFAPPNATNLPVMVFIYGGGFLQGSASVDVYDGSMLAARGVVVVTADYRVDVLGFLVTEASAGNFGLQDQRLYLQWVQQNIANFGGNPANVTLFGESAGAMSISAHLISPLSAGLFQKVIIESNPIPLEFQDKQTALTRGSKLAEKAGCPDKLGPQQQLRCLRNLSADHLLTVADGLFVIPDPLSFNFSVMLTWMPVIDGVEVPMEVMQAFEAGKYHKLPMIIGSNQDEGDMFTFQIASYFDNVEYAALIAALFKGSAPAVLQKYPPPADPKANTIELLSELVTHYLFACPSRKLSQLTSAAGVPAYLYHFDHPLSFDAWGPHYTFCNNKTCHGAELPFVFASAPIDGFDWTAAEALLADNMVTFWTNFAINGANTPNSPQAAPFAWPAFNPTQRVNQNALFATPSSVETGYVQAYCDFWDTLGYSF